MSAPPGYETEELTFAQRNPQTIQINDGFRIRKTDTGYVAERLKSDLTWQALDVAGAAVWGGITGTIANQTDLAAAFLIAKQSLVNNQNSTYTTVLLDAGKTIVHNSGSAHTHTIDSNANVAYPIGTMISWINAGAGVLTIAITSDTLNRGDGTAGTGSRTLAASSCATAIKTDTTVWWVNGKFAS